MEAKMYDREFKDVKEVLNRIEKEQWSQRDSLSQVREKVFDGFGEKIDAVERNMNQLREDIEASRKDVKNTFKSLVIVFISGLLMIIAAIIVNIFVFNSDAQTQEGKSVVDITSEYHE